MKHTLVEKVIKPGEICVRCLLHPMHVKGGNGRLQDASLIPARDDRNVSMLRHEYASEEEIAAHGRTLAENHRGVQPQEFKGLLYVTQNIVNSVNQWLTTSFSKLNGVDNVPEKMAELRYAPMINAETYLPDPETKDVYADDADIALPHHADLRYAKKHTAACQTEVRFYGREMMKRVRYKLAEGEDAWRDEVQTGAFQYFNQQPQLSIIIPFYNDQRYVKACAESILAEVEGNPVEVIWVGDTPTDRTASIVAELVESHPDVFYMYGKEHGGQGMARNEGLKVARGQYVWFVDADDKICKGSVAAILESIQSGKEAYMFHTEERDDNEKIRKRTRRYLNCAHPVECCGEEVLLKHLSFAPSLMCIFRRSFLLEKGLSFTALRNLDMDFMPRFLREAKRVELRPEVIYTYYYHTKKKKYSEEDTLQLLSMYEYYGEFRKAHEEDENCQRSLAYVQQMILSQIIQLPTKRQFSRLDTKGSISSLTGDVCSLIKTSDFRGVGLNEKLFWLIACFSIKRANWYANLWFNR